MRPLLLRGALVLSLAVNLSVAGLSLYRQLAPAGQLPLLLRVQLEEVQKAEVLALRSAFLADRAASRGRTDELRVRLASLLGRDASDPAAVDSVLGELAAEHAALQRRVVAHVLAVRAALRPEQRSAFDELMTENLRAGVLQGEKAHTP